MCSPPLPTPLFTLFLGLAALLPAAAQDGRAVADPHPDLKYYTPPPDRIRPERLRVDICVYGGTAGGVMTAIQAARDGRSVIVVAPEAHPGGLTTGGLSYTDFGNKGSIGGISREFYRRLGKHYGVEEEWKFEPKVAEAVMQEMIAEAKVPVRYRHFLKSVAKDGALITSLTTERGLTVEAAIFIDATYEGDLMAKAGVGYFVGREANETYGETLNGVQIRDKHQFEHPVSPYVVETDPASGLLPHIEPGPAPPAGSADNRVQAYNFRMTLTQQDSNRIPFAKPAGYDPREYVLAARYLRAGWRALFNKFDPIQGGKVDTNNHGATSTDFIGASHRWPEAGYAERERIFQKHVIYQKGLMWFFANDPAVPGEIREKMSTWGLARDEFVDTGGWPRQLYVREARRMVSDYVMTEHECRGTRKVEDPVGLGAYGMDSHNVRRIVVDGRVMNDGDVQVSGFSPYGISYRSVRPKREECRNLLVPVCVSTSHIAYGSVRMEPVFMILGQSCAVAADIALTDGIAVQDVPYDRLRKRLTELKQVVEWTAPARPAMQRIAPETLPGVVVDDAQAKRSGTWTASTAVGVSVIGSGYVHDSRGESGASSIAFTPHLPRSGIWEIIIIAPPHENRATNAPVTLSVEGGDVTSVRVDMREGSRGGHHPIGRFSLPAGKRTTVIIYNRGADGYVVADAVQFLPVDEPPAAP